MDHAHVRVINIQDVDMPTQKSAAAAAAAAAAGEGRGNDDDNETSRIPPPPPGLVNVAYGGGGLPRHVLAAVAGAQVHMQRIHSWRLSTIADELPSRFASGSARACVKCAHWAAM